MKEERREQSSAASLGEVDIQRATGLESEKCTVNSVGVSMECVTISSDVNALVWWIDPSVDTTHSVCSRGSTVRVNRGGPVERRGVETVDRL